MKKIILELLVCMLLIATIVPVASVDTNWTQQQKLTDVEGREGDYFGESVSIDGDTVLIGAYLDDDAGVNAGSVFVYTRTGNTWTQQAKLHASDAEDYDWFGYSVSISGDTALIGAYNYLDSIDEVYVFTRTGTTWTQQAKLTRTSGESFESFGSCLSLDTNTALIGASSSGLWMDSIPGSAYVFTRTGNTWAQQQKLSVGIDGDYFGRSVSISGDTALIGSQYDEESLSSSYIFTRAGNTWSQQVKLVASDSADSDFGRSVSLSGNTALIGTSNLKTYVFTRTGITWTQQAKLEISLDDYSDYSIALDGDTAIVGNCVFIRSGTTWTQQATLSVSDRDVISLDDDTAIFGTFPESAFVFTRGGETEPGGAPIADFNWKPSNPDPNQQITFDASESNDIGGSISLYEWDWNNDGVYEESHGDATIFHLWPQAGSYQVTLRITDNNGETDTITKTVILGGGSALWTQKQKLVSSDGDYADDFGQSISLDSDTVVIGAGGAALNDEFSSGYAYVFTRTGNIWKQQQKISVSDSTDGDGFGSPVSLSGDTILIGAPGAQINGYGTGSVYVFTRTGTSWTQQTKLEPSGVEFYENFGLRISLDGNTALIGASESAYVFTRTGTTWTQQAKLEASDSKEYDDFGFSVLVSGDTAIIGARGDDDNGAGSGSAYVFTRSGTTWTQQQKLLASDGRSSNKFGSSVALSGNTALIGAVSYPDFPPGSVYVFIKTGATWTQQAKLIPSDTEYKYFGRSVSLDGDTAFIGAAGDYFGDNFGKVYVFTRTGTTWTQQYRLFSSDNEGEDCFGSSVALSGETALIGSPTFYPMCDKCVGSVYVFTKGNENGSPEKPQVVLTWEPSKPEPYDQIYFDATNSNDPDGFITLFEWDWNNDGVYEESFVDTTASHSWSEEGNYTVIVRVTDNGG